MYWMTPKRLWDRVRKRKWKKIKKAKKLKKIKDKKTKKREINGNT